MSIIWSATSRRYKDRSNIVERFLEHQQRQATGEGPWVGGQQGAHLLQDILSTQQIVLCGYAR